MKYMAAYLLAVLGGDKAPDAAKVTSILDSVGIKADSDSVAALITALGGKDLNKLIEEGTERLSTVIGAGGGGAAPAAGGDAAAAGGDAEEKPAEEEEDDSDESVGGLGLFGGSDSDSDSD